MTLEQLQKGNKMVEEFKVLDVTLDRIKSIKAPINNSATNISFSSYISHKKREKVFLIGDCKVSEDKFLKIIEYIENTLKIDAVEIK